MIQHDPDGQDGMINALINWSVINEYAGCRLGEWAQNKKDADKNTFARWINEDNSSCAFIFTDMEFYKSGRTRVDNKKDTIINSRSVQEFSLRWRFQKNKDNGAKLFYKENKYNPARCPKEHALKIRRRAQRLNVKRGHPIGVYKDSAGQMRYINEEEIKAWLQAAARAVYGITDPQQLKLWSAHSYRVGACVTLHIAKVDADTIKIRLRWKSDCYRDYLRDVDCLADLHNAAVARDVEKLRIMLDDSAATALAA